MAAEIQKVVECGVCYVTYDAEVHKPKNLSCGHTFCLPCLEDMHREYEIRCPTCRKKSRLDVAGEGPENLMTNFSVLAVLETLCRVCTKQLYATRCEHCDKNICTACQNAHSIIVKSGIENIMQSLKTQLENFETSYRKNSIDMEQVCEDLINRINTQYDHYISMLTRDRDDKIRKTKSEIENHRAKHEHWLHKTQTIAKSTKDLVETLVETPIIDGLKAQCEKAASELDDAKKSMPMMTKMEFVLPRDEFRPALLYTGNLVFTERQYVDSCLKEPQYDHKAVCVSQTGNWGCKPGEFSLPQGIAVCPESEKLFVADRGNNRIQVLSKNLEFMFQFSKYNVGDKISRIQGPRNVMSIDNNLYICGSDKILVTDMKGTFIKTITGGFNRSTCIGYFENKMYICDLRTFYILEKSADGQYYIDRRIPLNVGDKTLCVSPDGVVITHDGNISFFDLEGTLKLKVESNSPPNYMSARAVALDQCGNILVGDSEGDIHVMNNEGQIRQTLDIDKDTSDCINGLAVRKYSDTISILATYASSPYIRLFHVKLA